MPILVILHAKGNKILNKICKIERKENKNKNKIISLINYILH